MIVAHEVSRRFGDRTALDAVDMTVGDGSCTAIFGRNGSGKTTLARLCAGMGRPDAGTITVGGFDVQKQGDDVRGLVGLVLSAPPCPLELTLDEATEYACDLAGVAVDAGTRDLIERFGLGSRRRDALRTFSRGMKQRFSLLAALVSSPPLLILDEPYDGLDPSGQALVDRIIEERREAGLTTLLVLHDVRRGLRISDAFIVLDRGQRTSSGRSAEQDADELERWLA